ncbi:glutathione S-transferase family protein [Aspergillus stella-maris]|uniref:glutathione S-transferase family protein n=1 Tax=Aspergillus stella-maris TaxID=1810926 RepID=UPI003CCDD9B2
MSTLSPTLTIYRGSLAPGAYVWSPFVTKLEARLRFAGVPYKADAGSIRAAPRRKIPYAEIKSDDNGTSDVTTMGDSTLITRHLIENGVLSSLNDNLSTEDRAHDLAIRALLEDKTFFYNTRERWTENYYTMRDTVLAATPYPIRVFVASMLYRNIVAGLYTQGTGRYTPEEVQTFRVEAWEAVSDLLVAARKKSKNENGQPFWVLGGEGPTEADASVFGFVVSVLVCKAGPKTKEVVKRFPVVLEYARRIHDAYFPDYELWEE